MARILLITNIFPPHIGGPASFIDRLAHALSGRGHDVTVVCSSDAPTDWRDRERPFRVRRVCLANRYLYEVRVRLVLAQELARHSRILVNGLESYVDDVARIVPRRYVLKIVGDTVWETARNAGLTTLDFDTFQQTPPTDARLDALARKRKRYMERASIIVTPSAYLKRIVAGWGVPESKLRVVPNGISLEDWSTASQPPRNGPLRVLFVGRLTNWKGVETLLLAAAGLQGIEVTIVGDGPELPLLSALRRQLPGTEHIRFAGRRPESAVKDMMREADVLVLPSNYEGLSHTLLEASACGLACVASAAGGNAEVISHEKTGLLVPYSDPGALRDALVRLRDDDTLRTMLGRNARASAHRFDFSRTVDAYVRILEDIE